eukprot:TRINITY_DN2617_c0_g1_i1.p1 TRINITY_DN2617_c0_g1~~TRINITY_DN2617_c0_g1_i1.p1  ORF type:complete len:328 (-),score=52.83 TRINITY_DN2617_c0_g1_i1:73-963(-)
MATALRTLKSVVPTKVVLEGGGFPVRRPFPVAGMDQFDPFLLLDHFYKNWGPGEAIGAPDHPHRGFETVSYLISGEIEHRDSHGHSGRLGPGDVQWMTAGAGIVHSEMPPKEFKARGGLSNGFQIWVNLPKRDKMMKPRYQDIPAAKIPTGTSPDGLVQVKVIAGEALGVRAAIDTRTPIMMLHYTIQPGGSTQQLVPPEYNVMAYVFDGEASVDTSSGKVVKSGEAALFNDGTHVQLSVSASAAGQAQVLLLAGIPLREPMSRYGPFVMNTREEIEQAFTDYQSGRFASIPADLQ